MKDRPGFESFSRALDEVLSCVAPAKAPAGLKARILEAALPARQASPRRFILRFAAAAACLVAALAVWRGTLRPSGPVIVRFDVDKVAVNTGDPIILSWEVKCATKILIKDNYGLTADPGSEKSIRLHARGPGHYVYTLIAMGPNGDAGQELSRSSSTP